MGCIVPADHHRHWLKGANGIGNCRNRLLDSAKLSIVIDLQAHRPLHQGPLMRSSLQRHFIAGEDRSAVTYPARQARGQYRAPIHATSFEPPSTPYATRYGITTSAAYPTMGTHYDPTYQATGYAITCVLAAIVIMVWRGKTPS